MRYLHFVCFHSNTARGRIGVLEGAGVRAGARRGGGAMATPPPAGQQHRGQTLSLRIVCAAQAPRCEAACWQEGTTTTSRQKKLSKVVTKDKNKIKKYDQP